MKWCWQRSRLTWLAQGLTVVELGRRPRRPTLRVHLRPPPRLSLPRPVHDPPALRMSTGLGCHVWGWAVPGGGDTVTASKGPIESTARSWGSSLYHGHWGALLRHQCLLSQWNISHSKVCPPFLKLCLYQRVFTVQKHVKQGRDLPVSSCKTHASGYCKCLLLDSRQRLSSSLQYLSQYRHIVSSQ